MFRVRCKIRKIILLFLLIGITLILLVLVVVGDGFFRQVFYSYQIAFHGAPGRYLATRTPNGSYCNFRYGLPEELLYEDSDLLHPLEEGVNSSYRVMRNVIEAKPGRGPGVTYATPATVDFLHYLAEIIRFWEGPISLAVFVPDFDADLTIRQLAKLCVCAPGMEKVSVHFVFPVKYPPYLQNHPEELGCELPGKIESFRLVNEVPFPINVCRNIARGFSPTYYVIVADIQLVPSHDLATGFMAMVEYFQSPSRVFVVPVFEIDAYDIIPKTKQELVLMVEQDKAVYFHRYICSHCQKFPGLRAWLGRVPKTPNIKPFMSVKREFPFHRWEPIYIGSKTDPLYSEALFWDGLQDKMTQMLEMCLIGYNFVILDNAFLIHWPGIKKQKHSLRNSWREKFQQENSQNYARIIEGLRGKYKANDKCRV